MNKIIYIISLMLVISSCSESFLDTEPLAQKVNKNFYKNAEDIELALNGIYASMYIEEWSEPFHAFIISEFMSDQRFPGGGADDASVQNIAQFQKGGQDLFLGPWSSNYQGIYRANMLLESLEQIEGSVELKSKAEAEARFLRAYFYFELVKMFGNVPLLTITAPQDLPKATTEELYAQIATDLKIAIEKLPETAYSSANLGRTTKWAAQGYMARVFLFYTGKFNKTSMPLVDGGEITKANVVTYIDECVLKSGHQLMPDFRNLWSYSESNVDYKYAVDNSLVWLGEEGANKETMFSLRYSINANWDIGTTWNNLYLCYLGWRAQQELPFGEGWGFGPVNSQFFNEWEEADVRKRASVCDVVDPNEGVNYTSESGQYHETNLWQKKYMPTTKKDAKGDIVNISNILYGSSETSYMLNNATELVYLRFADVLLMGAELGSSKAQQYLDDIRTRAGLTSVPVTLDAIKKERSHELAFEGIRYYDLMRWGDLESALAKVKDVDITNAGTATKFTKTYRKETNGFLPIPESQVNLSNGMLLQNNGW
jgi:hypothetical protein